MKAALKAFAASINEAEQALAQPMMELVNFINSFNWDNNSWDGYSAIHAKEYEEDGTGAIWSSNAKVGDVEVSLALRIHVTTKSFDDGHYLQPGETISTGSRYNLGIVLNSNREDSPLFKEMDRLHSTYIPLNNKEDIMKAKEHLMSLEQALIGKAKEVEPKSSSSKLNVKLFGNTVHVAPLIYQLKDNPRFKNYNLCHGQLEDLESDEPFVGIIVHSTYEKTLRVIKPYLDSSNQSKQPVSVYLLFVNKDIQERTNQALNLLEQAGVKSKFQGGNYLIDEDTESLSSSIEMMFEMM